MNRINIFSTLLLLLMPALLAAPCQAATVYTYDELNRLTRVVYDDGRNVAYSYDSAGNLLQRVNEGAAAEASLVIDLTPEAVAALGGNGVGSYAFETAAQSGRSRPAARFTAGYIRIPNSAAMQFSDGFTFDLWARVDSPTALYMNLLAKSHDRTGIALLSVAPPHYGSGFGYVHLATFDPSWACTGQQLTSVTATTPPGSWFRITYVASKTTGMRQYVNQQLISSCPNSQPSFATMNTQDLFIGRFSDNYWYPLNGAISDIRIYKKALTEAEVAALH